MLVLIVETPLPGAYLIEPERFADERGYFARTYSAREFAEFGLEARIDECSTSFNPRAGTLRGMHFQTEPHAEAKLVRCSRGAVHDVALDLRPRSPTYLRWHALALTEANGHAFFIPAGCAHGFQTLVDNTEVLYQISVPYEPSAAGGVRWNDPRFGIVWPDPPSYGRTMSERDASYPDFRQ